MKVHLEQRWIQKLVDLPESGMGYQRVDLRFADGRQINDVPVLNAEELDLPEEFADGRIADLQLHTA